MEANGHTSKDASQVVVLGTCGAAKAAKSNSTGHAAKQESLATVAAMPPTLDRRHSYSPPITTAENKKKRQRRHAIAVRRRSISYWVHVKTTMDLACRVRVLPSYKVATLMCAVRAVIGIVPSRVCLVQQKCGKEIVNSQLTLREAGIVAGDVLLAVPRVRTGLIGGFLNSFSTSTAGFDDSSLQNDGAEMSHVYSHETCCASRCEESRLELERIINSVRDCDDFDLDEISCGESHGEDTPDLLSEADNDSDIDAQSNSEENARTRKRMAEIKKKLLEQKNAKKRRLHLKP